MGNFLSPKSKSPFAASDSSLRRALNRVLDGQCHPSTLYAPDFWDTIDAKASSTTKLDGAGDMEHKICEQAKEATEARPGNACHGKCDIMSVSSPDVRMQILSYIPVSQVISLARLSKSFSWFVPDDFWRSMAVRIAPNSNSKESLFFRHSLLDGKDNTMKQSFFFLVTAVANFNENARGLRSEEVSRDHPHRRQRALETYYQQLTSWLKLVGGDSTEQDSKLKLCEFLANFAAPMLDPYLVLLLIQHADKNNVCLSSSPSSSYLETYLRKVLMPLLAGPSHSLTQARIENILSRRIAFSREVLKTLTRVLANFVPNGAGIAMRSAIEDMAKVFGYQMTYSHSVGDVIGGSSAASFLILEQWVQTFDFRGLSITSALRLFLAASPLPGEAQSIDRILSAMANSFIRQNQEAFPDLAATHFTSDQCYMLLYCILMLSTDLHSPHNASKMTLVNFSRSLRGMGPTAFSGLYPASFIEEVYYEVQMLSLTAK